jgi:hypothetical protein
MCEQTELKIRHKCIIASAVGILLGFGLCWVDAKFMDRGRSELGGSLSGLGALLCFLSLIMLISWCIAAAVDAIRER